MGGLFATLMLPQALGADTAPAGAATGPWTFASGVSAKTGYDDNVMLQDIGDQSCHESWINFLGIQASATYQANPLFKAMISYAPEFTTYDGESTENHATHRGLLNLSGASEGITWESLNSVTRIDGDDQGPRYTLNGLIAQIPAVGALAVRDRRDATIFKHSFKLTKTCGRMFVRPVATLYHHDFMTEQHASAPGPYLGYENYVDRQDINGGIDFGYEAWTKTWLVAGVRVGQQKQYELLGTPSPYSNDYYRILMGIEGTPAKWLKLNVMAGPDFRDFDDAPPGYSSATNYYFMDATATITPTKVDTITAGAKRFLQPSFASHSMYEDIVYELTYKHQIDKRFTAGTGLKAYHVDWVPPASRDEWVFTPSVSLGYTHSADLSAELAYSYDWTYSQIHNMDTREYTRHLVWLGLKHAF